MQENPLNNGETQKSPTESQAELRFVYRGIPERKTVEEGWRAILEKRQPVTDIEVGKSGVEAIQIPSLAEAGFPTEKQMELLATKVQSALEGSPATESCKEFVEYMLGRAVATGVDKAAEEANPEGVFHTLGVCEADPQLEGLFSPDTNLRQQIEAKLYKIADSQVEQTRLDALQFLNEKHFYDAHRYMEIGQEDQERLNTWKKEYQEKYGIQIE